MKLKQRALTLLLSVAMLVTFMPALAFAEDAEDADQPVVSEEAEPETAVEADTAEADELEAGEAGEAAAEKAMQTKEAAEEHAAEITQKSVKTASSAIPKSVSFTPGATLYGWIGTRYVNEGLYAEGAEFTVTFSNGSKETYKYVEDGFYLNGDPDNDEVDPDIEINAPLAEGDNNCKFSYYWEDEDDEDNYRYVECDVVVVGRSNEKVTSVKYTHIGSNIQGTVNYNNKRIEYPGSVYNYSYEGLVGDKFTVTVDGEETTYTCKEETDEEGDSWYSFADDEGYTGEMVFADNQADGEWTWESGKSYTVKAYYEGVGCDAFTVEVPTYTVLKSAKLTLTDGFEPAVSIGQDYVYESAFYGTGNKFVVTYSDDTTNTFKYNKSKQGFYDDSGEEAHFDADLDTPLEKGVETELTFTYWTDNDDDVSFTQSVKATKEEVYIDWNTKYQYTGKVIKPKVVVKTVYSSKTLASSLYSYTAPKYKKIGVYGFDVILNTKGSENYFSTESDDRVTLLMIYSIVPKKATIKKAKAGKKSFTVTWKKLSKKEQKQISGFVIEYSLYKDFSDSKIKTAKKGKTSLTVKSLKANKKYYVRVYTYKKTGVGKVYSKASKTKTVKTKK